MIDPQQPLTLLGGQSPATFMRRYWHKKPLLIRQAIPAFKPPLSFAEIKRLARDDQAQARLIYQEDGQWQMEHGPFGRLPTPRDTHWTVLLQGADLHSDAAAALLHQFRFIPDARLDDMMISIAGDGGGVGPHFDSYDVFLLQAQGRRQWRIGQQKDLSLLPNLPLKVLREFIPDEEHVLEPGDMLYLPPQVAHDGTALGECMTISIGFRAPTMAELAQGMLEAASDQIMARAGKPAGPYADPPLPGAALTKRYRDPRQAAVDEPAALPETLVQAALDSVRGVVFDERLATRFLGCWLTEPHASVQFDEPQAFIDLVQDWPQDGTLALDRRTRMVYRDRAVFINGEVVPMAMNNVLKQLADSRELDFAAPSVQRAPQALRELLDEWLQVGWVYIRAAAPTRPARR